MPISLVSLFATLALLPGLALGRLQRSPQRQRRLLGMAAGVLLYLLLDLLGHANELPRELLTAARQGEASWRLTLAVWRNFLGGFVLGCGVGLAVGWLWSRYHTGASSTLSASTWSVLDRGRALGLSLLLATSIGLYNFAQGMAIGQAGRYTVASAVNESGGAVALLLLGFLLHNATKGALLMTPFLATDMPLSERTLLALGGLAGLPTLAGTVLGRSYWDPHLFVSFLTIAAGATWIALYTLLRLRLAQGSNRHLLAEVCLGLIVALVATFVLEVGQYSLPELMSTYWLDAEP